MPLLHYTTAKAAEISYIHQRMNIRNCVNLCWCSTTTSLMKLWRISWRIWIFHQCLYFTIQLPKQLKFLIFIRGITERHQVGSVRWDTWPVLALVGGFSAAQFLFYVITPCVLRSTSATALNLALFTADFYILITGIAFFDFKVKRLKLE